jgi:hypothetical protein
MGLCLIFALFTNIVDVTSSYDAQWVNQVPAWLRDAIYDERIAMIKADAWRSLIFIALGFAVVYWYAWKSNSEPLTVSPRRLIAFYAALAVLVIADMMPVNKRFFSDDNFMQEKNADAYFAMQPYEQQILQDKSYYRVLNLASNTFNENNTAYWHKSVGGYHAAKLRRYQEMIEEHISGEMSALFSGVSEAEGDLEKLNPLEFPVLNMLNTRYFIFPLQGGQTVPLENPFALGNAWFVNEVQYVANANEEIEAIHGLDPSQKAVVDKKFQSVVQPVESDSTAVIELVAYEPNYLKYEVDSEKGGTVVFSEIYYPGWQSTIDGKDTPHGRANYILRAMNVPAGKHVVEFRFDPKSLHTTETIAYIALALLVLGFVAFVAIYFKARMANKK